MADLAGDRDVVERALGAVQSHGVENAIVTGWVVLSELMTPEGDRFLCRLRSDTTTQWQMQGMLHNALHTDWDDV